MDLSVESADVATAVEVLRRFGYPRDDFSSLGDIFAKQGLISSPLEERVRYIYGLSQSISETLTQIDGVSARASPCRHPRAAPAQRHALAESAASVFIKTRPGFGIEDSIPKIKMVVQNAVEGLAYDKISVAVFQTNDAAEFKSEGPTLDRILGMQVARDSMNQLTIWGAALGVLLLLAIGGNGYFAWRLKKSQREAAGAGNE